MRTFWTLVVIIFLSIWLSTLLFLSPNRSETSMRLEQSHLLFPRIRRDSKIVYFDSANGTQITQNVLYSESLASMESKTYLMSALEGSLVIAFFKNDSRLSEVQVKCYGPLERIFLSTAEYASVYLYYVTGNGDIEFSISNTGSENADLQFYIDTSILLKPENSKSVPLESGWVVQHVDLRNGEIASVVTSSKGLQANLRAFALCLELNSESGWGYVLQAYTENSDGNLSVRADLEGRFFVIAESYGGDGTLYLTSNIDSPFWTQERFWAVWPAVSICSLLPWFIQKIRKPHFCSRKKNLVSLSSGMVGLASIALLSTLVGSVNFGPSILRTPLFVLSILVCGLDLGMQIFASYLDTKETVVNCLYCGKEVNLHETDQCCGEPLRRISVLWYFSPVAFCLLLFAIGFLGFGQLSDPGWWGATGSVLGGIASFLVNNKISRKGARWLLVAGIAFSFFSPVLLQFLVTLVSQPHVDLDYPGKLLRIRMSPPILPLGVILAYAISVIGLGYLLANQVRKAGSPRQTRKAAGRRRVISLNRF